MKQIVQALSLLLVLAAFMGITAASMPELTETFAEEVEQMESMDGLLPDLTLPSPPNPIEAITTGLCAILFHSDDDFRTGIFPEILTPPPI